MNCQLAGLETGTFNEFVKVVLSTSNLKTHHSLLIFFSCWDAHPIIVYFFNVDVLLQPG